MREPFNWYLVRFILLGRLSGDSSFGFNANLPQQELPAPVDAPAIKCMLLWLEERKWVVLRHIRDDLEYVGVTYDGAQKAESFRDYEYFSAAMRALEASRIGASEDNVVLALAHAKQVAGIEMVNHFSPPLEN